MEKKYFVYITTDLKRQKLYLGCRYGFTDVSLDKYFGSSIVIRNIIKSRGHLDLRRTVLEIFETREEMLEGESWWGNNVFNVADDERFYNQNRCGLGGFYHLTHQKGVKHPRYGSRCSQETKDRISASNRGKKRTDDSKRKMSEQRSGENHWNYGKTSSETSKEKNRQSNINRWKEKLTDPVIAKKYKELGESKSKRWKLLSPKGEIFVFLNLAKAARENGFHAPGIISNGKSKGWKLISRLEHDDQ